MGSFVTAGWVASSHGTEQYLQVDFEAIYDVTALEFTRATLGYGTRKLRYINSDTCIANVHVESCFVKGTLRSTRTCIRLYSCVL